LEKVEAFNECILEGQVLPQNPNEFCLFDILQAKHSMPNQASILSLIGTCYAKLGHSFEASKYLKQAFDANSFDLGAFADVVQREKGKESFVVCGICTGENEGAFDVATNSPASSVNKRLSLPSITASARANTRVARFSSVQMGISRQYTEKVKNKFSKSKKAVPTQTF
jgi:hypothetical protein